MNINTNGINKVISKGKCLVDVPVCLAYHPFIGCLLLFIVAVAIGGFVFYKYSFLAERAEPEAIKKGSLLNEEVYKEILGKWQEQEARFNEADLKDYPNPFKRSAVVPEEEAE
jgi:hypothetical protein